MSGISTVNFSENSREEVAFKLMLEIAKVEDKTLYLAEHARHKVATREWILDTYAECLEAVNGQRMHPED